MDKQAYMKMMLLGMVKEAGGKKKAPKTRLGFGKGKARNAAARPSTLEKMRVGGNWGGNDNGGIKGALMRLFGGDNLPRQNKRLNAPKDQLPSTLKWSQNGPIDVEFTARTVKDRSGLLKNLLGIGGAGALAAGTGIGGYQLGYDKGSDDTSKQYGNDSFTSLLNWFSDLFGSKAKYSVKD